MLLTLSSIHGGWPAKDTQYYDREITQTLSGIDKMRKEKAKK